jgi:hypothetical protein
MAGRAGSSVPKFTSVSDYLLGYLLQDQLLIRMDLKTFSMAPWLFSRSIPSISSTQAGLFSLLLSQRNRSEKLSRGQKAATSDDVDFYIPFYFYNAYTMIMLRVFITMLRRTLFLSGCILCMGIIHLQNEYPNECEHNWLIASDVKQRSYINFSL